MKCVHGSTYTIDLMYPHVWLPPKSTGTARPLDTMMSDSTKQSKEEEFYWRNQVAVNADNIVAVCRLLSLRADDINGKAVEYLRDGLLSASLSENPFFFVERHNDALEYLLNWCLLSDNVMLPDIFIGDSAMMNPM